MDGKKNEELEDTPALSISMDIEEVNPKVDLKTAEITLAAAMNYSDCPVCFETLLPPVYQCCNGHIICCNCIERIDICVECRVALSRKSKIRNIALEKICSNLYVDCANKNDGCGVKVTVEWLRNHLKVCPYTPFNFCSDILGRKKCKHAVNDLTVFHHLETLHSITKVNYSTFRMWLNVSTLPLGEEDFFFEPLLVTSMEIPVLIRSVVSADGYFVFTGFTLKNDEDEMQNIRLKFRIESQSKEVGFEWSGSVQSYRTFKETNFINSCRIPVKSFIELWGPNVLPQDITAISIDISVWKKSFLSQEDKVREEVHIFEESLLNSQLNLRSSRSLTESQPLTQETIVVESGVVASQSQSSQRLSDFLLLEFSPLENENSFSSLFSD